MEKKIMPKYTSQIKSEESAEKVHSLIANFLAAQGYKPTMNKRGSEWRKGFYWFKYVGYAYSQGIINLEVWNYCPYPGMGSFLMYFIGIEELKKLLKDLEEMLSRKSSLQDASQMGAAEFQGDTAGDAVPGNLDDAELQSQAVPAPQKKTVVGFAKAWIIFWIIGNLAATCAPINQLTIPGASGITAIVMFLSGAIAAGYIMLYNKNPFGLYLVLIANLLALSMSSPYTLVKTGLIPGIITFFITYKQIAYPFGKTAVTKANLNPTISDNLSISRQQNTNPDVIVPEAVPVSKPVPAMAATASTLPPETKTPAFSDPSNLKECLACHKQVENLQHTCPYCGGTAFAQAGSGNDALSLLDSMQKQAEAAEHVDRGAQLIMQGRYAEAESELKKAIEINPLNATAHGNMGGIFIQQGMPEKAIPWLEKALQINPHLEGIPQALAQARTAVKQTGRPAPVPVKKHTTVASLRILIIGGILAVASLAMICCCLISIPVLLPILSPTPTGLSTISNPPLIETSGPTSTEIPPFIIKPELTPSAMPSVSTMAAPSPTAAASIHIHATPKTILDVGGWHVLCSPDGKWLIIGERKIHFYDAQSLIEVRAIQADRWVTGMAISPDSKILAAIDESRGVMLFDVASGSELLTLPRTQNSASVTTIYLAFSPDSATLAVIIGEVVKLFDVASGQETATIVTRRATNIIFSPDGKSLYVGGGEDGITVWDITTGTQIRKFGDSFLAANRIALSPDGSLLVSAGTFNNVEMILWDAATGRQLHTFTRNEAEAVGLGVKDLAFSPDGRLLASAEGEAATIKLWDVATGSELQTLVGHSEPASSIAISPDGATLVSGSEDGTTRLWTLSAGEAEPTPAATASTTGVEPTPQATFIPLSSRAITVENAAQVTKQSILDVSESGSLVWSPDGKWLVIGGRKTHYFDAQSFTETRSGNYENGALAISPNSKILVAAMYSPGVVLFDLANGSELLTLPRTQISTSALSNSFLAFSPDSATIAVVIGNVVKLYNVASGQEINTIVAQGAFNIAISPDGKKLYAGGWGENITVWDIATGSKIRDFGDSSRGVNRMILSPDGSLLASAGTFDGAITLWDAATGRQLRTFTGHTQGISSLAFSPDGKVLASAAEDVTIKLWDTATGNLLNTLVGHSEPAKSIAISPDGATLASSSYRDGVLLWSLPVP
jgi:WD40 repeat protein